MAALSSNPFSTCWQIAKKNLRHNFLPHLGIALCFVVLTPLLFGTSHLSTPEAALPLEMFLSIIGVVLLTPLFFPEQNPHIEDLVCSKFINILFVYVIRITYAIVTLLIIISIFCGYLGLCGSQVTPALWFGTISDALFLGSLGLFSAASNNTALAYMIPLLYYGMNFSMGSKLGHFYLFAMREGNYAPNLWLFAGGIVFLFFAVLLSWLRRRYR